MAREGRHAGENYPENTSLAKVKWETRREKKGGSRRARKVQNKRELSNECADFFVRHGSIIAEIK